MNSNARKHQRNQAQANGRRAAAEALPRTAHELAPLMESLLLRETPHLALADSLAAAVAAAARPAAGAAFRLPAFFGAEQKEGVWTPPVNARETDEEMILEV